MRVRYLVLGVVLLLAVITGVLILQRGPAGRAGEGDTVTVTVLTSVAGTPAGGSGSGEPGSSASGSSAPELTAPQTSGPTGPDPGSSSPSPSSPGPASGRRPTNVPMKKLKVGEKAPQFIIFSFDGAGSHEKWQEFMAAAEPTDSRFTGFLTGLYLLTDENKEKYTGPGHSAGKSSVGFGGTDQEVATLIGDLNQAYARGDEIGTHYNGHFCSGAEPSGSVWSTADWNNELDQFFGFFTRYRQNNPGVTLPELMVPKESVNGGRTQCLEGKWEELVPAWKKHGFSYDSSINAPGSGVSWPARRDGIWEFYMPYVYSPGFGGMVINMDYNMWVKFNGGKTEEGTTGQLREKVYQTYTYLYDQAFAGNRAPLLVANHFNNWNGNAFNPSVLKFMQNYCGKSDTVCATYSDVVAWLELQDPAVLAALQDQPAVAAQAP